MDTTLIMEDTYNLIEEIKNTTSDDIINCAKKYFTDDFVLAVLKP